MTVFILYDCESAVTVYGVYSTYEKAKSVMLQLSDQAYTLIEEVEVDKLPEGFSYTKEDNR